MHRHFIILSLMLALASAVDASPYVMDDGTASENIIIDTVTVGNPGNAGEWSGESYGGFGPDRICGAVDYTYNIGKCEVTAGQYTAFLNSVAGVDTYGLYSTEMWLGNEGCKIERYAGNGTPGNPYQYRVANNTTDGYWADRPVSCVSYWDACRFANWLHNGQPTGAQGPGTTETGAYTLNGGQDDTEVQRNPAWQWAVTSEDEWYKAAYHKNDGVTGNYWDYPMGSSAVPGNGIPDGDTGNSANFLGMSGFTLGGPYWRTPGGYFSLSDSPYGTFDQGGNVWEWNESVVYKVSGYLYRGCRGGGYRHYVEYLHAEHRNYGNQALEGTNIGFRVVSAVPEPGSMVMLALGVLGIFRKR